jgi:hypothetical protein
LKNTFHVWVIVLLVWPAVWVVWAFLWRGGISLHLLGLSLVRSSGRPAWRLQCAWRALLVWLPVTALMACSLWLDVAYWAAWVPGDSRWWLPWLSSLACWSALALLPLYVLLAVWSPERSLHDRLAGTYLVPK